MLKTSVLVRQVSTLHDARYCAGMGVAYISIPLVNAEKGNLSPDYIKEIGEWLSGIDILGDVGDNAPDDLADYSLDGIETTDSNLVKKLTTGEKPVFLSINISPDELDSPAFRGLLEQLEDTVESFICMAEGALEDFNREEIKSLNSTFKLFWGFTFTPENVVEFIDDCKPKGVVLQGTKEIKTGLNDFEYLADILEALDTDEYI